MKKFLAVLLIVSLIFGSCIISFAENDTVENDTENSYTDEELEEMARQAMITSLEKDHQRKAWLFKLEDVSTDDWYYPILPAIYGIMNGISDTEFAPQMAVTRSMFVTILYRIDGNPEISEQASGRSFSDVESGIWYSDAVKWAADNNIVTGIGNNKFAPDNTITKEQIATMLYNYSNFKQAQLRVRNTPKKISDFSDLNKVSEWAKAAIAWAVENGIINGSDKGLEPQKSASRAEIAQIVYNYSISKSLMYQKG